MSDYRKMKGLNQSLLKQILKSPRAFKQMEKTMYEESDNPSFRFGTLVDIMITEPDTDIDSLYITQPDIKISDSIKPILNELSKLKEFSDTDIIEIADKLNYCKSMTEPIRLNRIKVQGWLTYISFKRSSNGKTIITQDEYNKAITAKMSVISDPYISKYFTKSKHIEIIYKDVIQEVFQGIEMKYELDLVVINHELKVIQPLDLKTTSDSVYNFKYSFWKYRYDFQAVSYFTACERKYKNLIEKGYQILPFRFIVVEKDSINKPLIYELSHESFKIGLLNGEKPMLVTEGLNEAIKKYKWHTEHNKWDYPMEYYKQGYLKI